MTPEVVLHIGAHKTGTTALQTTFRAHARTLARHGVLYPASCMYHAGHHRIAFALKRQPDPHAGDVPDLDREVDALLEEIARTGCRKAIISSEALFVCPNARIEALRRRLDGYPVTIVAVVRRQDAYLSSLHNHLSRQVGGTVVPRLAEIVETPRAISREISYLQWLRRWRDAFEGSKMKLRRYEDAPPVAGMLRDLGLSPTALPEPDRINGRVPVPVAEAVRLSKAARLPVPFQRAVRRIAGRTFRGASSRGLTEAQREAILRAFAEENAEMFETFGLTGTWQPADENPSPGRAIKDVTEAVLPAPMRGTLPSVPGR